jgi:hypothetical protein
VGSKQAAITQNYTHVTNNAVDEIMRLKLEGKTQEANDLTSQSKQALRTMVRSDQTLHGEEVVGTSIINTVNALSSTLDAALTGTKVLGHDPNGHLGVLTGIGAAKSQNELNLQLNEFSLLMQSGTLDAKAIKQVSDEIVQWHNGDLQRDLAELNITDGQVRSISSTLTAASRSLSVDGTRGPMPDLGHAMSTDYNNWLYQTRGTTGKFPTPEDARKKVEELERHYRSVHKANEELFRSAAAAPDLMSGKTISGSTGLLLRSAGELNSFLASPEYQQGQAALTENHVETIKQVMFTPEVWDHPTRSEEENLIAAEEWLNGLGLSTEDRARVLAAAPSGQTPEKPRVVPPAKDEASESRVDILLQTLGRIPGTVLDSVQERLDKMELLANNLPLKQSLKPVPAERSKRMTIGNAEAAIRRLTLELAKADEKDHPALVRQIRQLELAHEMLQLMDAAEQDKE